MPPPETPLQDTPLPDKPLQDPLSEAVTPEAPFLRRIVEQNRAAVAKDDEGLRMRAQHGRSHGCVAAMFRVRPDLPDRFRHGLFAQPGEFQALIRFSNGAQFADDRKDAHGMAIKLLNVPGEKLLGRWREQLFGIPETPDDQLDFVLVDTDTYPSWEPEGYEALNRLITGALAARRALDGRRPLDWDVISEGIRSAFRALAPAA